MNSRHNHSVLYNLPPIGIGTMEVESLTSYISRIADAHCVEIMTLVNEILINELKKENIYKDNSLIAIYKNGTSKFNGISVAAIENTKIMNKLCGREDLGNLTLIKYKNILNDNKLMKATKSWCPYCLADMNDTQYEKLIWNICLVDVCHIHHTKLEDTCSRCGANQRHLRYKSLNGYCQKCSQWLGSNKKVIHGECETSSQKILNIGDLLQVTTDNNLLTNKNMLKNLSNLWVLIPSPKREFLESKIGIRGKLITDMRRGIRNKISLSSLIKLCAFLNCSINDLLCSVIDISFDSLKINESNITKNSRKKVDCSKLEKKLIEYLSLCKKDERNYLSINELEKEVGHSACTIQKFFPVVYEKIKKQNIESRARIKKEKQSEKLELIKRETIDLHNSGVYPSLRKVHAKLPFVITGFEKDYRDTWEATINELGLLRKVNQYE